MYVATAHGGVWKTVNNGTTFDALFQDMGHMSVASVTMSQSNPDLVWIGTGESNNRQSTSRGTASTSPPTGVRPGRTWVFAPPATSTASSSIPATTTLSRGGDRRLWDPAVNGIYKTTDGGRAWKQVLKVDDDTGANDLVMDPGDGKVLYASTYQRRRTACCMNGGGPGSGIWKSTDGGDTWTRIKGACSISRWAASPSTSTGVGPVFLTRSSRDSRSRAAGAAARVAAAQPGAKKARRGGRGGAESSRRWAGCSRGGGQQAVNPNDPTGFYRVRRCGRDVAQGAQCESASDVFPASAHRPERLRGRITSAGSTCTRRSTAARR